MAYITREQAIEYLNSLGDPVDWETPHYTLEEIRAEVLKGDEYDGGNIWQSLLEANDAQDLEWEIVDWMGNVLFNGVVFPSYEDGWDYIYAEHPDPMSADHADESYYDDFYVQPRKDAK